MHINKTPLRHLLTAIAVLALVRAPGVAQGAADAFAGIRQADVMLLGTFHFDDAGLDDYKPRFPWNPAEQRHQAEIEDVVARLARFRPTRVAVEWPIERQAGLDSAYGAFIAGRAPMRANERQQLGFRLARLLGHTRVFAVDASARSYTPDMSEDEFNRRAAELIAGADRAVLGRQQDLEARYRRLAEADDSLKTTMPLREYLVRRNDPRTVLTNHGQYLIGGFYLGRGDDYLGPDARTRWFNRNLRIFHNIQRITASPDERILVIIGAGHIPMLRHAAEASPEYRLVEVSEYLGR